MSPIYFLKVEFEDVGNSLDASSSDLTVIKVNGSQFFFTNKKKHKMHCIRLLKQVVYSGSILILQRIGTNAFLIYSSRQRFLFLSGHTCIYLWCMYHTEFSCRWNSFYLIQIPAQCLTLCLTSMTSVCNPVLRSWNCLFLKLWPCFQTTPGRLRTPAAGEAGVSVDPVFRKETSQNTE